MDVIINFEILKKMFAVFGSGEIYKLRVKTQDKILGIFYFKPSFIFSTSAIFGSEFFSCPINSIF